MSASLWIAPGESVLGKAGASETRSGMQELAPNAAIKSDATGDVMDVGTDLFATIGHFVDEGDLHGQERTRLSPDERCPGT